MKNFFLVIFIIATVILGIFLYSEISENKDLKKRVAITSTTMSPSVVIFTKIIHYKTPQSGTWQHCFETNTAGRIETAHENREFQGDRVEVPINLQYTSVTPGDWFHFKVRLDDDDPDVCTDRAEDKREGDFQINSPSGKAYFNQDGWEYEIYWEMK